MLAYGRGTAFNPKSSLSSILTASALLLLTACVDNIGPVTPRAWELAAKTCEPHKGLKELTAHVPYQAFDSVIRATCVDGVQVKVYYKR